MWNKSWPSPCNQNKIHWHSINALEEKETLRWCLLLVTSPGSALSVTPGIDSRFPLHPVQTQTSMDAIHGSSFSNWQQMEYLKEGIVDCYFLHTSQLIMACFSASSFPAGEFRLPPESFSMFCLCIFLQCTLSVQKTLDLSKAPLYIDRKVSIFVNVQNSLWIFLPTWDFLRKTKQIIVIDEPFSH